MLYSRRGQTEREEGSLRLDAGEVRRGRERLGYTTREAARMSGLSENTYLRAEHDREITPPTARKIAEAFGLTVADLYPKARTELTAEWARSVSDTDIFLQHVHQAPTPELFQLVKELGGNFETQTLEDVRRNRGLDRTRQQQILDLAKARLIAEELRDRPDADEEDLRRLYGLRVFEDKLGS
jgi:transcriptional regulator with XRE-family HTH domain